MCPLNEAHLVQSCSRKFCSYGIHWVLSCGWTRAECGRATAPQHDDTLKRVADKLGKNPAAVLVRWAIQHGTSGARKFVTPAVLPTAGMVVTNSN